MTTPGRKQALRWVLLVLAVVGVGALLAGPAHAEPSPSPGAGATPAPTPGDSPDPSREPGPQPGDGPNDDSGGDGGGGGSGGDSDSGGGKGDDEKEEKEGEEKEGEEQGVPPSASPPAEDAGKSHEELREERKEEKRKEEARKKEEWKKKVELVKSQNGGVLGAFNVTDRYGIPADAYQVDVDSGGITDFQQKIQGFLIEGMFSVTKWIIAFSCWLIAWALSWSLASILLRPALAVSDALHNQVIVQLGLVSVLITFSGTVAAWHLFFGNRSRGWGELAASTVISALAVTAFTAPPQMLLAHDDGAVGEVRQLGLVVAAVIMDRDDDLPEDSDPDVKDLTRPITDELVHAFIAQPAMQLTYDQSADKQCTKKFSRSRIEQAAYNQEFDKKKDTVKDGINQGTFTEKPGWAQSIDNFIIDKAGDLVRDQVVDKEPAEDFEDDCVDGDAGSLKKASWDKVGGALFVLIAALLVFALLIVLTCGFLVAQALLAVEAMFARATLVVGILPGPGRAWLWERAVATLRWLGALIAIVVGLAVFILVITSVLGAKKETIPGGLTVRFLVVDLLCVAAFIYRRKIAARGRSIAADLRGRLGSTRLGGQAPAQLEQPGQQRSMLGRVARAGVLLGTMAATGGSSATALGTRGASGALGTRLAARGVRRGGRLAGRATVHTAKAAGKAGKAGLKYGLGAPVYGPRAVHRARAAAQAMPGRARGGVQSLRHRLASHTGSGSGPRQFAAEYWHNVGGRWATNRWRIHRGLAPIPAPSTTAGRGHHDHGTSTRPRPRPRPAQARAEGGAPVGPTPAPPAAGSRLRTSPSRPQPPRRATDSSRSTSLHHRLHRVRARTTPPPPSGTSPRGEGRGERS